MKKNDQYKTYWDGANGWIVMDWDGYANSQQFIQGIENMYKLIKEHNASRALANLRDMTLIALQDQYYIYSFLPRAIEAGFRAIAIVKPTSYFNAVAIETLQYRVNETVVQMRVFDDKELAKQWLMNLEV